MKAAPLTRPDLPRRPLPLAGPDTQHRPQLSELARDSLAQLRRVPLDTLQLNLGRHCNMACKHCHVDAGPNRSERMSRALLERVLSLLAVSPNVRCIDITGGAPELHPDFRWFVQQLRHRNPELEVIDRCNLTVLLEDGQEQLATFLAEHNVQVVASLPCYSADNVDRQRGGGAYERSIRGLQRLNQLGYGQSTGSLKLTLVYNPLGPSLPPAQGTLEAQYREILRRDHGIEFNALLTLTNMPVRRFAAALTREGQLEDYMQLLADNFNPRTVPGVMCRSLLSVGYDGGLYDCDFNQMLDLPCGAGPQTLWELTSFAGLESAPIRTAVHCLGCTAGAGSSCSGALQPS